jgi:hypothetical protein
LGEALEEEKITFERMDIRMAGIYDTVSSHGLVKWDDVSDLQLKSVSKARYIFHLTAADERRYFFPLVRITPDTIHQEKKAQKENVDLRKIEKELPGVHSDVGGSYVHNVAEAKVALTVGLSYYVERTKQKLIEDGWYKKEELSAHRMTETWPGFLLSALLFFLPNPLLMNSYLSGKRKKLSSEYSHIALHFMSEFSTQYSIGVNFLHSRIKRQFPIPIGLEDIEKRLHSYVFDKTNTIKKMAFYTRKQLEEEMAEARLHPKRPFHAETFEREQEEKNKPTASSTNAVPTPMTHEKQKESKPLFDANRVEKESGNTTQQAVSTQVSNPTPMLQKKPLSTSKENIISILNKYVKKGKSPSVANNPILKENQKQDQSEEEQPLDENEFEGYPELQEKIKDHKLLLSARYTYLHQSADWRKPGMNPTVTWTRTEYEG